VRASRPATSRPATSRPATALAAAGCGLVLLLSGCSSEASADAATPAGEELGPLGEYYEQLYAASTPEDADAQTREREALITTCMQEQGFEYVPMDPASDGSYTVEEDEDAPVVDWDSEEYAATEGYGVFTYDEEDQPVDEGAEEYVDPNEDYVAAMSETERTAFYEALYGPSVPFDEDAPEEAVEYDWTTAGCSGAADHEVAGDQPYDDPAFSSLMEEMDGLYEEAAADPAMAALDAAWSGCMADAGFPGFARQPDAAQSIYDEQNSLYESAGADGEYVEPEAAVMAELEEQELETAVADARCREEVDYRAEEQEIRFALEQEFVDTHQAELEALVAAHGQGS
jgi:hypothetical protein